MQPDPACGPSLATTLFRSTPPASTTTNGLPEKKLTHSQRQKRLVQQLEKQLSEVQQQFDELTLQNTLLKQRSEVLAHLVQCADAVDQVYTRCVATRRGQPTPDELAFYQSALKSFQGIVSNFSSLLVDAEMDSSNPAKQAVLAAAVKLLCDECILMSEPCNVERHAMLHQLFIKDAMQALKVPEEEHWREVIACLQLTPDQVSRARITWDLFRSTYTSLPHSPSDPTKLAPPLASPSSPWFCIPTANGFCFDPANPPAAPTSSSHTTPSPPASPTSTAAPVSPSSSSSSAASSLRPPSATGASSKALTAAPANPPPLPPFDSVDMDALKHLDTHLVKFKHWSYILDCFILTRLLNPIQAVRAVVKAYPLFPTAFVLLQAIVTMADQPRHRLLPPARQWGALT